jgi:hypothetical protein
MAANYYAVSVGTTAILLAPAEAGSCSVYNNGTATIYVGFDATVTTATGTPIVAGGSAGFSSNTYLPAIYGISGTASQDTRVMLGVI